MNLQLLSFPKTELTPVLRYRDGLYAADLLAAAISHLDFFTWLDQEGGATAQAICQAFDFAPRPVDVLLTLCRANGFIQTSEIGVNLVTAQAREHLVSTSPFFLGPYYDSMKDRPVTLDYLTVLKTGKPANWASLKENENWHDAMHDENFARGFTAAMDCRGLALGQALAAAVGPVIGNRKRLLDIGGGSGIYAATLVAAHQQLSATILEQAPVDALARASMEKHGLADQIDVNQANMFTDPWPEAEIHLLSNVLHDWDFPEVRMLIEKSAEALPPGGLVIIHEVFINDAKTGPIPAAEYSALLMQVTQGKCYTPAEYGAILAESGFEVGPYVSTVGDRGYITAIKPQV